MDAYPVSLVAVYARYSLAPGAARSTRARTPLRYVPAVPAVLVGMNRSCGPRLLKLDTSPNGTWPGLFGPRAATASALNPLAGPPTVFAPGPELPAENTTLTPPGGTPVALFLVTSRASMYREKSP